MTGDGVEIGLRALERSPGLEPANPQVTVIAAAAAQLRRDRKRRINLGALWIVEIRGHYPNDGPCNSICRDCLVDNVRIGAETTLPQAVSEQSHSVFAWLVLFGGKTATKHWLHAHDVEKVRGDLK